MTIINQATCKLFTDSARFTQLAGYYEEERRTLWMMLRAQPRPCFNHALIEEIMNLSWLVRQSGFEVDFWVTGSLVPDIYNTGGDLRFFVDCIENGRREAGKGERNRQRGTSLVNHNAFLRTGLNRA